MENHETRKPQQPKGGHKPKKRDNLVAIDNTTHKLGNGNTGRKENAKQDASQSARSAREDRLHLP